MDRIFKRNDIIIAHFVNKKLNKCFTQNKPNLTDKFENSEINGRQLYG